MPLLLVGRSCYDYYSKKYSELEQSLKGVYRFSGPRHTFNMPQNRYFAFPAFSKLIVFHIVSFLYNGSSMVVTVAHVTVLRTDVQIVGCEVLRGVHNVTKARRNIRNKN